MKEFDIDKVLLKKWRTILTRYSKYEKDWWKRIYKRGLTNVIVDLSKTKSFYLEEMNKARKIVSALKNK